MIKKIVIILTLISIAIVLNINTFFNNPKITFAEPDIKNETLNLQLLGINDFHGQINITRTDSSNNKLGRADYLYANFKNRINSNSNTLLVHSGDIIGGSSPLSALLNDDPTLEILNAMGFDIGTVGNHEFDKGLSEMLRHTNDIAKFSYTLSNVVYKSTKEPILEPYIIKKIENIPIGFIGVVTTETKDLVFHESMDDLEFLDETDSINKYVEILKNQGVHTIIVLAHVSASQDSKTKSITNEIATIAQNSDDEVDVIYAGHNHKKVNGYLNNKLIIQSKSYGLSFSDVDLVIDKKTKDVIYKKGTLVDNLQENIEPDEKIKNLIEEYENSLNIDLKEIIGYSDENITKKQNKSGESKLGNLIADAQNNKYNTDFAFLLSSNIRSEISKGEITYEDLFTIQPFGTKLVTMNLTGKQIQEILNQQWRENKTVSLQLSGLKYTWDSTKPIGSKVIDIYLSSGEKLNLNKEYTVTVNEFLANGGANFSFNNGKNKKLKDKDLDVLIDYIKKSETPINPTIDGRIKKIK
jgi:5'-nucleotidase